MAYAKVFSVTRRSAGIEQNMHGILRDVFAIWDADPTAGGQGVQGGYCGCAASQARARPLLGGAGYPHEAGRLSHPSTMSTPSVADAASEGGGVGTSKHTLDGPIDILGNQGGRLNE